MPLDRALENHLKVDGETLYRDYQKEARSFWIARAQDTPLVAQVAREQEAWDVDFPDTNTIVGSSVYTLSGDDGLPRIDALTFNENGIATNARTIRTMPRDSFWFVPVSGVKHDDSPTWITAVMARGDRQTRLFRLNTCHRRTRESASRKKGRDSVSASRGPYFNLD